MLKLDFYLQISSTLEHNFSRTPGKKERMRKTRDETTFGTPIDDDMLTTEFDFEKNLALFDKQVTNLWFSLFFWTPYGSSAIVVNENLNNIFHFFIKDFFKMKIFNTFLLR